MSGALAGVHLNGAASTTAPIPIASTSAAAALETPVAPVLSPVKARDFAASETMHRPAGPSPLSPPAPPSGPLAGPSNAARTTPSGNVASLRARSSQGSSQNVRLPPSLQAKMAAVSPLFGLCRTLSLLVRPICLTSTSSLHRP
jgi:hypothetical protein